MYVDYVCICVYVDCSAIALRCTLRRPMRSAFVCQFRCALGSKPPINWRRRWNVSRSTTSCLMQFKRMLIVSPRWKSVFLKVSTGQGLNNALNMTLYSLVVDRMIYRSMDLSGVLRLAFEFKWGFISFEIAIITMVELICEWLRKWVSGTHVQLLYRNVP